MNNCYFADIEYHIGKQLKLACSRIVIAVAWFTNERLADILIEKGDLLIEVVVDDNDINRSSKALQKFSDFSIKVSFVTDLERKYLMHNKFCIIDNQIVITGSYNWTNKANLNSENIIVVSDKAAAVFYMREFRSILERKVPDRGLSISESEVNSITTSFYNLIKLELKSIVAKNEFVAGYLLNYENEKLRNSVRVIDESISNAIYNHPSLFHMEKYLYLVKKYGSHWFEKYSNEDLVEIKSNISLSSIQNHEKGISQLFNTFKIKALDRFLNNYRLLLKDEEDEIKSDRILKIFQYLNSERNQIIEMNHNVHNNS